MKYAIMLIGIVIFYFSVTFGITYILLDNSLETNFQSTKGNVSTFNDVLELYTRFNYSEFGEDDSTNINTFLETMGFLFSVSVPFKNFPTSLAVVIKFINWLLAVLLIVIFYKLANPLSSA